MALKIKEETSTSPIAVNCNGSQLMTIVKLPWMTTNQPLSDLLHRRLGERNTRSVHFQLDSEKKIEMSRFSELQYSANYVQGT